MSAALLCPPSEVLDRIEVVAVSRLDRALYLRWPDGQGGLVLAVVPSNLLSDAEGLAAQLARHGVQVPPERGAALATRLQAQARRLTES